MGRPIGGVSIVDESVPRSLIVKYMATVIAEEGTSFVDYSGYTWGPAVAFDETELSALKEIEDDARKITIKL